MEDRDSLIRAEAAALWQQLHGGPPPEEADGSKILDLLLGEMADAAYERLANPFLRPTNIVFPKHS